MPSREKVGLVFTASSVVSFTCRVPSWLAVRMLPSTLNAKMPGLAGPNGGGTRGREPAR